jgi:methionyl-tRNA synthetase
MEIVRKDLWRYQMLKSWEEGKDLEFHFQLI